MKIYFAGSIRGGRSDQSAYFKIINLLKNYGEVFTEHVGDHKLTAQGEVNIADEQVYKRDMKWLMSTDVLVVDVTTPSLGVGYEIASAEILGKKILCIYRESAEKRISGMINGNRNLTVKIYKTIDDVTAILKEFFG